MPAQLDVHTVAAATAIGLSTVLLFRKKQTKNNRPQKLEFDCGKESPSPLPLKIITSLPDFLRIPLLTASAKPSPPKDAFDILGPDTDVDPFEKSEILPGKIWRVRHSYLIDPEFKKAMEGIMGSTMEDLKQTAIKTAPDHLKETLVKDFEIAEKYDALSEGERAKAGGDMKQDMFVIKIEEGLILYNPVRMHPQLVQWIKEELGEVKYIVSGSSSHTNHLPHTASIYPDAKIVCASAADAKCKVAGMRPADYLYDVTKEDAAKQPKLYAGRGTMEDAREALEGQAKLFHVKGDVCTQALFVIAHQHLFEVDLLYSPSEEGKKENEFETGTTPLHSKGRIFFYGSCSDKVEPVGYELPVYRVWFMDPTSVFSRLGRDVPKNDGSTCLEMADSLRSILKVIREPGVCERAHSVHALSMSMEDFCKKIDGTWGWLDVGKSLIE